MSLPSSLDLLIIPFKRREQRDISLSRITSTPVNLETNITLRALLTPTFNKKKREKSLFGNRLLNEILPLSPSSLQKKHPRYSHSQMKRKSKCSKHSIKKRMYSEQKLTKGSHISTKLEKIVEANKVNKEVKMYEKHCDIKRHHPNNKLIANFLCPLNSHISKEFTMNMDDYTNLTQKIQKRGTNIPPLPFNTRKQFKIRLL